MKSEKSQHYRRGKQLVQVKKENPFDKFSNARRKHEVLNRKVKGEDRNVGRALAKAVEVRKKRLLEDYKSSKKSSVFIDRRFGENDADLSLEDKMMARFQKERLKKSRNKSIFNLEDDNAFTLTHKGKILTDETMIENEWSENDDEDENDKLGKDLVNQLHFGGGMIKKVTNSAVNDAQSNQVDSRSVYGNHMTALQEIVAKSKMYKAQRKELKLEQEDLTEQLDSEFQDLLQNSFVEFREDRHNRSRNSDKSDKNSNKGVEGDDTYDDEYDKALHMMTYETKVRVTDRTKTSEEIAVENREKLEELEKQRMARMKASYQPELIQQDNKDMSQYEEKRQNKRKKDKEKDKITNRHSRMLTDDDLDDTYGAELNEDGEYDDNDNDMEDEDNDYGDDIDMDDDEDEGDEEDAENEIDEDEDDDIDVDDDQDDDDDDDVEGVMDSGDDEIDEIEEEQDDEDDLEEDVLYPPLPLTKTQSSINNTATTTTSTTKKASTTVVSTTTTTTTTHDHIPHKIECPVDMNAFNELLHQYIQSAEDVILIIDRIVMYNSVHLPGILGKQNKELMHNFLEMLFKHFIRVGDSLCVYKTKEEEKSILKQLDHLTSVIYTLSQDLHDVCGALWGKYIKILHAKLLKNIRDYTQGTVMYCWPSIGQLLFFQLIRKVFSITDYRHIIIESTYYYLCQCITQCPINTIADLVSGLFCTTIMIEMTAETKRFIPEIWSYLSSILALYSNYISTMSSNKISSMNIMKTFNLNKWSQLRSIASSSVHITHSSNSNEYSQSTDNTTQKMIDWHWFHHDSTVSSSSIDPADSTTTLPATNALLCTNDQAISILKLTQHLIHTLSNRYMANIGYPELLTSTSILSNLQLLRPHDKPTLSTSLIVNHTTLLETITNNINNIRNTRKPLYWRKPQKVIIQSKNPRFDIEYKLKKDRDTNEDRVKLKQLIREKKREEKAVMRELRRDSDFLEQAKFKEKVESQQKAQEERYKNFTWLEQQQAALSQQVRKGGEILRGGGSGITKKPRVKRK